MVQKKGLDMTEEKKHRNIHQRMLAVMKEISYVQKEDKLVNGSYRFVSHDAVMAAVRKPMLDNGVVVIPTVSKWAVNENRVEAQVNVQFVNADEPSDSYSVAALGFGIDRQDKGPGKAFSYACKYALLKALMLETGDDPERDNINHGPPPRKAPIIDTSPLINTLDLWFGAYNAPKKGDPDPTNLRESLVIKWAQVIETILGFPFPRYDWHAISTVTKGLTADQVTRAREAVLKEIEEIKK